MTLLEAFWVGVCGLVTLAFFAVAIRELWSRLRPAPEQEPELELIDRMALATSKLCTQDEAHIVIRASRSMAILTEEVLRLPFDHTTQLDDRQLHGLFLMCCRRTIARAGRSAYRGESQLLN